MHSLRHPTAAAAAGTPPKRLLLLAVGVAVAASIIVSSGFVARASNPHLAYYSPRTDAILWFVQISDTHIGASGTTDSDRLRWVVTTGKNIINPSFIVATGDLTDSTNGNIFGYPNGPYQAEWDQYKSIVDPYVNAGFYYDIPGNHDAYNDKYFAYYVGNSVQGRATGGTQVSWTRSLPSGETYHFLGANTAGNDGRAFSLTSPYGDYAGLDTEELSFIQKQLIANAGANLTMVFGHHPVTDTGASDDTWLFYGQQDFIRYLDTYKASVYGYGHTHAYSQVLFKGNSYTGPMGEGIAYDNVASLGKSSSSNYAVFAIDCNGVSSVGATPGTWPVVLITSPVDAYIGTAPNPYAYTVPAANTNTVRALIFDPVANPSVSYRIDGGTIWYSMTRVSGPVWQGTWDASSLKAGNHTIEVRAIGTTTRSDAITVNVTGGVANRPPVAVNDSYPATSGSALTVAAPGVLTNDSDPDGNTLTVSGATQPGRGTVTVNSNGSFTYTSTAGYTGTDSFTYTASDGTATSNAATVTITVTTPAPTKDTVTITSATYTKSTKTLVVRATSSAQPNATLTVVGYGPMSYDTTTKTYLYSGQVSTAPKKVTVTSNLGGSATRTVTVAR